MIKNDEIVIKWIKGEGQLTNVLTNMRDNLDNTTKEVSVYSFVCSGSDPKCYLYRTPITFSNIVIINKLYLPLHLLTNFT